MHAVGRIHTFEWIGNKYFFFNLGNNYLYMITSRQAKELRIDLEDFAGNKVYAKYSTFSVGSETEEYKLTVGGYIGDAGNDKIMYTTTSL